MYFCVLSTVVGVTSHRKKDGVRSHCNWTSTPCPSQGHIRARQINRQTWMYGRRDRYTNRERERERHTHTHTHTHTPTHTHTHTITEAEDNREWGGGGA